MKLSELLEELKDVPPETELTFEIYDGCCGDTEPLSSPEVEHGFFQLKYKKGDLIPYARIIFPPLDFMKSCISSGIAQHAVRKHREKK